MGQVFVKGYMKAHGHVRGYTRRQTRKAQVILSKLNRRNERNLLKGAFAGNKKLTRMVERDNQRGRRIINKYL